MRISIDALTLKSGGAKKHLEGMLSSINESSKFEYLLWVDQDSDFKKYKGLKVEIVIVNKFFSSNIGYLIWQIFFFEYKSIIKGCQILFIPSGLSLTMPLFLKKVSIFRNMLFEEVDQIFLYDIKNILILLIKKIIHEYTIKTSNCFVCLTEYAKKIISHKAKKKFLPVIPHSSEFVKTFENSNNKNNIYKKNFENNKFNIFYPSHFSPYKNQHLVIREFDLFMKSIKKSNNLFGLHFAGNKTWPYYSKLKNELRLTSFKHQINIYENMSQKILIENMSNSDILLFASTCENYPNLLIEMMHFNKILLCQNKNIFKNEFGNQLRYFDINKKGDLCRLLKDTYIELSKNDRKKFFNYKYKQITFSENFRSYEKLFQKILEK